jgi:hypothetical protein
MDDQTALHNCRFDSGERIGARSGPRAHAREPQALEPAGLETAPRTLARRGERKTNQFLPNIDVSLPSKLHMRSRL